jgi:PucR C-terminal helix-turn-helix domain/GGDEF-like domain
MSDSGAASVDHVRAEVIGRLRARRLDLAETIFARVRDGAFSNSGDDDAQYVAGLRAAVVAAVEYGLEGMERGEEWAGPIPVVMSEQARRAARVGVSLDTVLRRYVVGHTLLEEFVMEETDRAEFPDARGALRGVLRAQAVVLDRLLEAITGEYGDELARAGRSPEQRRAERVRRLLDGGAVEQAELGYELGGWHLGVIVAGARAGATRVVRELAAGSDRRLLSVEQGPESMWAWLGGRERIAMGDLERIAVGIVSPSSERVVLAVGEPGRGIEGWRLTHQQAQAAMVVALRRREPRGGLTRYGDVALLASALKDELLARGLMEIYLAPLGDARDGGLVLRETLRAYIGAERSVSSAASALGVTRSTVEARLRTVEQCLGRLLPACLAELEVALRLEDLGDPAGGPASGKDQAPSA